jgi:hypothetical protein
MKAPFSRQNATEDQSDSVIHDLLMSDRFTAGERLRNLPLFMRQKDVAHILFMSSIYKKILTVPGYIAEFGVMWGRNLNLLHCLRECYEPYNHTRHLLGFDTFSGFVGTTSEDRVGSDAAGPLHRPGAYSVAAGHEEVLAHALAANEARSHLSHLRRFSLIKGDVTETIPKYLADNAHAIFALCYFDLDLYKPTKIVLDALRERLVRGSVLVFDEVLNPDHPGETQALQDALGLNTISLRRSALSGWKTYCVIGE